MSLSRKGKIPKNIKQIAGWNKGQPMPQIRGANSPFWKGFVKKGHKREVEYRLWRLAVFERDAFTCQDCGIKGGQLEAHHIKSWKDYPELRFEISNGKTLCVGCHLKLRNHYESEPD